MAMRRLRLALVITLVRSVVIRQRNAVERRHLGASAFGGALAVALPQLAEAAPAWLADVPTESAAEALAPPVARGGAAPAAPAAATRETAAVVAAQDAAINGGAKAESRRVTATVRVSARVARSDGTFSVRDNDEDPPLFGDVDLQLFGEAAPAAVALFLGSALGDPAAPDTPTYARSLVDERRGASLVVGGRIKGLSERDIFGERVLVNTRDGSEALSPRGASVAAKLGRERSGLPHDGPGLLTRRRGDAGVDLTAFGLTLKASPQLDPDYEVFGAVARDDSNVLAKIASLGVYSMDAVGPSTDVPLAAEIYRAQKDAFRGAAKAIGDGRANAVFPGKILRRVEVTRVQLL